MSPEGLGHSQSNHRCLGGLGHSQGNHRCLMGSGLVQSNQHVQPPLQVHSLGFVVAVEC